MSSSRWNLIIWALGLIFLVVVLLSKRGGVYGYNELDSRFPGGSGVWGCSNDVVDRKQVEINYVNAVTIFKIKAKRFEPQPLQQDGVGLSSEASYTGTEIKSFIRQVFGEDGETWALCVCDCESSYRSSVVSSAGYVGLFQYEERTFYTNGGIDIFDWQEQVRLTKKLYDKGEQWRWPACNKRCSADVVEM